MRAASQRSLPLPAEPSEELPSPSSSSVQRPKPLVVPPDSREDAIELAFTGETPRREVAINVVEVARNGRPVR